MTEETTETGDIPFEDIAESNDMHLETLISLLRDKGVITQEEFDRKLDELYPEEE
ncbi:hypothetical protein GF323_05970 [Candidatus Woesearchaeota archaeon]|nr:hypothetical protein [Candidatus Woesearchaeota archaeon]